MSKAFHHLDYQWDFGNPKSRHPRTSGPLAVHVFDAPGKYKVQLTVVAPNGDTSAKTETITVTNPNAAYPSTKTVCFSNDKDFTGAPRGAIKVTTRSFDHALSYYSGTRRLLFKRGGSFTCSSPPKLRDSGSGMVGAFGKGTNPDSRGIYANNPVLKCSATPFVMRGSGYTFMDLRIEDITDKTHSVFDPDRRVTDVLALRCQTSRFDTPIGFAHDLIEYHKLEPHENITLADSVFENVRGNTCYSGGRRFGFVGNRMVRNRSSHLLRLTYAERCVIDTNELIDPGGTRHAIKLHAHQNRARYGNYSEKIVIRNNVIRGGPAWSVTLGPQGGGTGKPGNEWVREVLVEKNSIDSSHNSASAALFINSADTTIRNNVFIGAGGAMWDYYCIMVTQRGTEPIPSGVEIYHNTRFNPTKGHTVEYMVYAQKHSGPILIKNNLIYCPGTPSTVAIVRGPAQSTLGGNIAGVDPMFLDASKMDLRLKKASPARRKGVKVPVRDDRGGDRRGKSRPAAGAYQR